jgi:hypothetical protein
MSIFLILAPYGAFAFLMLTASPMVSLFVAAATCLAVIGLDVARGRSVKILAAGSAVAFAGLGAWLLVIDPHLSGVAVRVDVDAAVFVIALGSILVGRPFTLQYGVESVPAEIAAMPGFVRANYIISGAWAAAAAIMMAGNLAAIYLPGFPLWSSLLIAFAARYSALYFTRWYPEYQRTKHADAIAGVMQGS